jgi:hypothetical protein
MDGRERKKENRSVLIFPYSLQGREEGERKRERELLQGREGGRKRGACAALSLSLSLSLSL